MATRIFLNLPVADVARSTAFYTALGFTRDAGFSTDQGAAMTLSDTIHVMLLDHALYATFTPKPIADTHAVSAVLIALALDSRAAVDAMTVAAIAAGGREAHPPEDHGFMYARAFEDPDGHGFGPFHIDVTQELRAGGRCAIVMRGPAGEENRLEGVYLEVVPERRIVSTDAFAAGWMPAGPFMVRIDAFMPEGDRTRYTATARHWTPEARDSHAAMGFEAGWNAATDQLEEIARRLARR